MLLHILKCTCLPRRGIDPLAVWELDNEDDSVEL